jgi:hypothetical protein
MYQDEELRQPNRLIISFSHQVLIVWCQVPPQEEDPHFYLTEFIFGVKVFQI